MSSQQQNNESAAGGVGGARADADAIRAAYETYRALLPDDFTHSRGTQTDDDAAALVDAAGAAVNGPAINGVAGGVAGDGGAAGNAGGANAGAAPNAPHPLVGYNPATNGADIELIRNVPKPRPGEHRWTCPLCTRTVAAISSDRHLTTHVRVCPWPGCHETFYDKKTPKAAARHCWRAHMNKEPTEECELCDDEFRQPFSRADVGEQHVLKHAFLENWGRSQVPAPAQQQEEAVAEEEAQEEAEEEVQQDAEEEAQQDAGADASEQ
ncbi:hypothetical protein GGR52DRAFT_571391 [Hypoxylon sp. FL1284]|nr:hypothetical protein GGR52DRAFT_571391 [Hypoxylon sp. FL1284]